MTRYAIGDIHGGAKTFRALLNKIELKREDRVYLLGDYIDRGPDSKGVLDIIINLQNGGYDVRPVRGNHEDMLIRNIIDEHDQWSRYYEIGWGAETLKQFGVENPKDLPELYREFLFSLPYCREDEQFIFVHAGLDMSKDDPLTQTKPEHMMWGNGGFISDNDLPGRIIVSGHKMLNIQKIAESLNKPHIQIDNGAFSNQLPDLGNLVALNLESMEIVLQPWIDEEAVLNKSISVQSFQVAQETVPLIRDEKVSNLIVDEKRAMRMARVIMDNIVEYHPDTVRQGILGDNIFDLLKGQIDEGYMEFEKYVSSSLDREKIFNTALVDVLVKRAFKYMGIS